MVIPSRSSQASAMLFVLPLRSIRSRYDESVFFILRLYDLYEPVSVKTGLNEMKMEIKITAALESISFSKHFLKI